MITTYVGIVNGMRTWEVRDEEGNFVGINQSMPDNSPSVPSSATAAQVRLWLDSKGISEAQVTAAIDALPEDTRGPTKIKWEWEDPIPRDSAVLAVVATAFGMDSAALDQAFIEAASL